MKKIFLINSDSEFYGFTEDEKFANDTAKMLSALYDEKVRVDEIKEYEKPDLSGMVLEALKNVK